MLKLTRITIQLEADFHAEIVKAAASTQLGVGAYVRLATVERIRRDEAARSINATTKSAKPPSGQAPASPRPTVKPMDPIKEAALFAKWGAGEAGQLGTERDAKWAAEWNR